MAVSVSMIAALSTNRVIGVESKLPWYLPEDLKFFKSVTSHKPVIMGRATFDSIGKPLPNRFNIVISRNPNFSHPGVRTSSSLLEALEMAKGHAEIDGIDEVMVIGGGQIYTAAMPYADHLYLTRVDAEIEGDTFFPEFNESEWSLAESIQGSPTEHQPSYRFERYDRVGNRNQGMHE